MKITHTDIYRFSIPMEPFVIATGIMDYAQNVFVRVYTDTGHYGVGECSAFPMIVGETQDTCLTMAKEFAKVWKGKDAADIDARIQDLHNVAAHNPTAKSAFDMALYDLASKAAGQPLYKFLGGERRTVETDMTIGIGSPEEMSKFALGYKKLGATILKIKLGKKPDDDLERMRQIRAAVGPEMVLRIDANQGWDYEAAMKCLNGMKDLNIEFCEQPMRTWYDDRLPALREQTPIKIMADESCYNHHDARKLINSASCDYINIKFAKSGGINEGLKIHDQASKAGIPCMIGSMLESRIALTANLHFAYACKNIKFFDLDTCLLGHLVDPVTGGLTYEGYFLDLPDNPGIGADADEEFLKTCEKFSV
ncbi:mandelate racemase/muconate lactonizing enzyme family protein [Daejeonella lutea]|uniref:Dipeptide epimerase n=1 Tax=Daejeonella lutea TaxID=572036 RepID=A0A1T5F6G4_9SPHI|nr:dipeptide epimerase [Daejeonella lutea]SKB91721.1 o-succinylbenzoate synthase [Daejeonella lutea]